MKKKLKKWLAGVLAAAMCAGNDRDHTGNRSAGVFLGVLQRRRSGRRDRVGKLRTGNGLVTGRGGNHDNWGKRHS